MCMASCMKNFIKLRIISSDIKYLYITLTKINEKLFLLERNKYKAFVFTFQFHKKSLNNFFNY